MHIPISPRLLACCDFVAPGERIADIGCDHGYLSIHLLTQGIAKSAIAADVRDGPLLSAIRNAEKYGVRDKMEFYLSDGVQRVPRDFDTMICAGMGADTMISILSAAPWLKNARYRLILQCQSKTPALRRFLSENGWRVAEETVIRDGKFLYTVMEVWWDPEHPKLTVGEWYFPPALFENPAGDLPDYYLYIVNGLRLALAHRTDEEKETALRALEALGDEYPWLKGESS